MLPWKISSQAFMECCFESLVGSSKFLSCHRSATSYTYIRTSGHSSNFYKAMLAPQCLIIDNYLKLVRMARCLPGARIKDVFKRLQKNLKEEGEPPEVVVHITINDLLQVETLIYVLLSECRELDRRLKCRTSKVVISGYFQCHVLVRMEQKDKAGESWLRAWCLAQGF